MNTKAAYNGQNVFFADGESLAFSEIDAEKNERRALSLHGAGNSSRQRILYLAEALTELAISTFCFDFSGHGESSGKLNESSLTRRDRQAVAALTHMGAPLPDILIGSSMGGQVAIDVLPELPSLHHLLLFCPALYAAEARNLLFDDNFRTAISREKSYESAAGLENLKNYKGHLLIIIGDDDQVIPDGVIKLYYDAAVSARSRRIVKIPRAPHTLHQWVLESDDRRDNLVNIVKNWLQQE